MTYSNSEPMRPELSEAAVLLIEALHPDGQPGALSHQRPDDVLGEWSNKPKEEWNMHQRVADATGGWVTAANVVSVMGGSMTVKGGVEVARGNYAKGFAYIASGRLLDLADGYVSKAFGTRGKTGALVDAGIDKLLTLGAAVELVATDTISPAYATATVVQQGRIMAQNVAIEHAGGNPNPSKAGKRGMGFVWGAIGARIGEQALAEKHPRLARAVGILASGAEVESLILAEQAIDGYKDQRKELVTAK